MAAEEDLITYNLAVISFKHNLLTLWLTCQTSSMTTHLHITLNCLINCYCQYLAWCWRCQRKPSALALIQSGTQLSFDCRSAQLANSFR